MHTLPTGSKWTTRRNAPSRGVRRPATWAVGVDPRRLSSRRPRWRFRRRVLPGGGALGCAADHDEWLCRTRRPESGIQVMRRIVPKEWRPADAGLEPVGRAARDVVVAGHQRRDLAWPESGVPDGVRSGRLPRPETIPIHDAREAASALRGRCRGGCCRSEGPLARIACTCRTCWLGPGGRRRAGSLRGRMTRASGSGAIFTWGTWRC